MVERLLLQQFTPDGSIFTYRIKNLDEVRLIGGGSGHGGDVTLKIGDQPVVTCGDYDRLEVERDKLQAFKTYVHDRLDKAGVPADPNPEQTAKTGCRIGGRLDRLVSTNAWFESGMQAHRMIDELGARPIGSVDERLRPLLDELKALRETRATPAVALVKENEELKLKLEDANRVIAIRDGQLKRVYDALCLAQGGTTHLPHDEGVRQLAASRDHAAAMVTELTQYVADANRSAAEARSHVTEIERWLKSKDEEIARLRPRAQLADQFVELTRAAVIAGNSGPTPGTGSVFEKLNKAMDTQLYDLTKEEDRRAAFAAGVKLQFQFYKMQRDIWSDADAENQLVDVGGPWRWRIAP